MHDEPIRSLERKFEEFAPALFSLGYVLSETSPSVPTGWQVQEACGVFVAHHPLLAYRYRRNGNASLCCLGIIFDTRAPDLSQDHYLDFLVTALCESEDAFLAHLAHSNGRYLILYQTNSGRRHALTDATGIRCAIYHREARVISSHLTLLSLNTPQHSKERDTRSFRFGFPGRQTPLKDAYLLTPNTKLDFDGWIPLRFWPTTPIPRMNLVEATELVESRLANSYEWVSNNYDPFMTLTAGMDSRVTLAVARGRGRYLTYYRADEIDTDEVDRRTALEISRELDLDHTVVTREVIDRIPPLLRELLRVNTFRTHIPGVAYTYMTRMIRGSNTVHIRSNLSEIGRLFYRARKVYPLSPEDLVYLWTYKREWHTSENIASFDDFASATQFFEAPVERTSLFYWEHRMGAWHSQVALESDIACETLSLYNCRFLLQTMLGVSRKAQENSWLMKLLVKKRWPELTKYPVNNKPFEFTPTAEDLFSLDQ